MILKRAQKSQAVNSQASLGLALFPPLESFLLSLFLSLYFLERQETLSIPSLQCQEHKFPMRPSPGTLSQGHTKQNDDFWSQNNLQIPSGKAESQVVGTIAKPWVKLVRMTMMTR